MVCWIDARRCMQAEIYMELGRQTAAQTVYSQLIGIVPDNYNYHKGLCTALDLPADSFDSPSPDVLAKLKDVYSDLEEKHPKCDAVNRIQLDFLSGEEFAAAAKQRIRTYVQRGVPALFSDLKPLVRRRGEKADALWQAALELLEATAVDADSDSTSKEAQAAVWLHLYLAQHAAEARSMREAVEHIKTAESSELLGATGGALDVYSAKADILAAAGDAPGAAAAAECARLLDLKDRYVNSMAAKFYFRAGETERAMSTAQLFAVDFDGNANNLNEMQVIWYELEAGRAHAAKRNLGMVRHRCQIIAHDMPNCRDHAHHMSAVLKLRSPTCQLRSPRSPAVNVHASTTACVTRCARETAWICRRSRC